MARLKGITQNESAFLDTIAVSEGTIDIGDDGYNCLVGSGIFDSYSTHPDILVNLGHGLESTAAGRYQLLYRYYEAYKKELNLLDFSPESQDKIALQQIKERRALEDINAGNIKDAISKCSNIWASFVGNNYRQHQNSMEFLLKAFVEKGGTLE